MSPMLSEIITGGVLALLVALATYFITTVTQRNTYIKVVGELIRQHEQVWHQESQTKAISDHAKNCEAVQDLKTIRKVVLALYVKQGGDVKDLDI